MKKKLKYLEYLEGYFDLKALKEELKRIGVTFITAGVAGIFLMHLLNPALAGWLALLGVLFLFVGLTKQRRKKPS